MRQVLRVVYSLLHRRRVVAHLGLARSLAFVTIPDEYLVQLRLTTLDRVVGPED